MGFAAFDTALGRCAVEWSERGLTRVWLPEAPAHATSDEPPPAVADAIDRLCLLLGGEDVDLTAIELDLDGVPEFDQQVYAVARALPRGVTTTYGELARAVGAPGAAQAVGQVMGHNRFPLVVPCHRVVAAGGGNGGFSAPGGVDTKLRLLALESVTLF
ncbi:MAG TPA: methylated-DNA--[protein]-cysteine S-methyltransferase [Mycobacteriales bacterium]|nr:methylated-DNA--[protein]-cysteine S-methyltransferase [Mycobacteriales bacterium]